MSQTIRRRSADAYTRAPVVPLELVTPLPPGAPSLTRLARHGARLVVLREIKDGTDCSWPPASHGMVTLQEVGELQGKRHALFEFVPGVTLKELLTALEVVGNPVPLGLVARVVLDAARSIEAISPARAHGGVADGVLQIGFDGVVSVLDFGAPRVSRFRPIGRVNFAADVFALGAVLHAALTGFRGEYSTSLATLPAPSTSHAEASPAIDAVVMRALALQPDARQPDVGTFADELEAVTTGLLLPSDKVADVVQALFRDRIKLLQSLGGLGDPAASADPEAIELAMPGIPAGTQPGLPTNALSEPITNPRVERKELLPTPKVAPRKPSVPWDSNPAMEPPPSEPTLPRASSLPAMPQVSAGNVNLTPTDDEEDERDERTANVSAAELRAAIGAKSGSSPPPLDEAEPTRQRPKPAAVEDQDTSPRAKKSLEDTAPRARPNRTLTAEEQDGDTNPTPMAPRNTTEQERLRARGQERLKTPPQGTPRSNPEDVATEQTNVKRAPRPNPAMTAQTAQTLPPAMDEEAFDEAPPTSGGGLKWLMRLMALVVAGLMVGVIVKVKRQQEREAALAAVVDAGAGDDEDDASDAGEATVVAANSVDAGSVADDAGSAETDAGTFEPVDAGTARDAGSGAAVDAGVDAGTPTKKPVKKPVKKKKKRR